MYTLAIYFLPSIVWITQWIVGWLWIITYIHFIIEFLNKYLDCVIVSEQWVIIFEWEWFLHYKLQQFDRDSIESISHIQNSLTDKLIGKWTLQFTMEHGIIFNFINISSPHRIAEDLRNRKQHYWSHHQILWDHIVWWESNEKFEILVETLWEVIKDYMGKNKQLPHKEKRDM
jgi:hypothetical protein